MELLNIFRKGIKEHKAEFEEKRHVYLIAGAYHETVKKIDRDSKQAVLDAHVFKISSEEKETRKKYKEENLSEHITRPEDDYLMSDEDFKVYSKLVHKERTKRGLKVESWTDSRGQTVPAWNTTSDYKSREALKKAEKDFLEVVFKILPEKMSKEFRDSMHFLDVKKKVLDLSLRLDTEKGL